MPLKVLAVDDEQDILHLLEIKLKNAGFEVLTAHDGEEGLHKARVALPDVVLLDVMMPRMDGYATARRIKAEVAPPPVVLMLTARSQDADLARSLSGGADDYILKPFVPRELVARIRVALERAGKPVPAAGE